jgi:hypothetical protein
MDWLRKQPQPLDVNNDSVAATIRYLKALALEKSEQLNSDLIRSILKLHKDYPQLAFGGQETLDTAVETAVDDIEANRRKWQDLEKKLDGTQGGDTELGARLLVKLSGDKISKIDNFMTVSAYSEQSDLVISSSRRFSTEVFRINVTSGTITKQSMPYMQPTTTTVVTKTESAYKDLVQHLLSLASDLRALNATGEELYQYFSGLVPAVQSELDKIKTQLINHVGSELTFRAAASAENYSPVSFRLIPGSADRFVILGMSSRSGYTEVEFFNAGEISVERNMSGSKAFLNQNTKEYSAFLDETILIVTRNQNSATQAGPAEALPGFKALLDYLNALRQTQP